MGIGEIPILFVRKESSLNTNHQALELLVGRNWCIKQNIGRLTRWLDRLARFDIEHKWVTHALQGRSFTKYAKKRGPSAEPWCIPQVVKHSSD